MTIETELQIKIEKLDRLVCKAHLEVTKLQKENAELKGIVNRLRNALSGEQNDGPLIPGLNHND